MLDEVYSKAPFEHLAMLQYQFLPALQKNFMDYQSTIRTQYLTLNDIADKMGNPKFIPTKELKETATQIIQRIEEGLPQQLLGKTTPDSGIPEYVAEKIPEYIPAY